MTDPDLAHSGLDPSLTAASLAGRRILLVEDEYMIAVDLADALARLGAEVVGPVPTLERALALATSPAPLDGAVLDVSLHGELVFPVADALLARGVPFVLATGYDEWVVPEAYRDVPRHEKPIDPELLARDLAACRRTGDG